MLIVDTHVHIYPCHDLHTALEHAFRQLAAWGQGQRALLLTERHDCQAFRDMRSGSWRAAGYVISPATESCALNVANRQWESLTIFAGRQIVSRERLEVLALATDAEIEDGQPVDEVLLQVRAQGGVPVLSWAPGKWFGERGRLVRKLLDRAARGELLVGDTSLRPTLWPEPGLMRLARRRGLEVLAGSDPLPFPGEERQVGRYASRLDTVLDLDRPVTSLRAILTSPALRAASVGRRCGVLEVASRWRSNARVRAR